MGETRQTTHLQKELLERIAPQEESLRSCEAKLLNLIRNRWALEFGTREVRLVIEYQDRSPVLIRVTGNTVKEEKLK